jgi:hypothetical protein
MARAPANDEIVRASGYMYIFEKPLMTCRSGNLEITGTWG